MADQVGLKLGNYQLERLLGRGGFAEVYLGKHIYLDTQAAIKVLRAQLDSEARARFLQEAKIIAGLKHPRIVGVLEFGIEDQRPFLVMAYAPHGTLRGRYVSGIPLTPTMILPHVKQVAEALQYAHDCKIIHRDVKPENMLLDRSNMVLLSDFGLAVRGQSSYKSGFSIDNAGTMLYMAPEQLRGKPCAASDQYALGVVMYEWLCGCLPFDGPDVSVVVQHLHEQPVPLRQHVPTIPEGVEAVVLRALAKDLKQRFASVKELAEALEVACKNIPIVDNIGMLTLPDTSTTENVSSSFGELQEIPSGELIDQASNFVQGKKKSEMAAMPSVSMPFEYLSLQFPSISASLDLNASEQNSTDADILAQNSLAVVDTSADIVAPLSQSRAYISRRTMLAGVAGIGVLLGGAGIWRLSSHEVGSALPNALVAQKGSRSAKSSPISIRQRGGTVGSQTLSSGQSSTATPTTKSNLVGTSTPSTPSTASITSTTPTSQPTVTIISNDPVIAANTVPTDTPTPPPPVALTVQIGNIPSQVRNRETVDVSITTNMPNVSFQLQVSYFGLRGVNNQTQYLSGTTDGSGAGVVSWTPDFFLFVITFNTYANLQAVATDQNGNNISSNAVSAVQITY